jgi:hypothetical protein
MTGMTVGSEKHVVELVGGLQALPRWFGSKQGQCDGTDRFTALTMEQHASLRNSVYAAWASGAAGTDAGSSLAPMVPVPQIHGIGGAARGLTQLSTIALSTLDCTAVCRALQLSDAAPSLIEAVRADDLDGRALAEIDEEYLQGLDGTPGGASGGARLKRKGFLRSKPTLPSPRLYVVAETYRAWICHLFGVVVREWSECGVPPQLVK